MPRDLFQSEPTPGVAAWHPDWLRPHWPAPAGVHAVCTTRLGGVSMAPYDGLNLGVHVGDSAPNVAHNRALLTRALGHEPAFLHQVHGSAVLPLPQAVGRVGDPTADAACTSTAGVVCTVMVADCLPVLLCSSDGAWVAAAHAGWRGLAGQLGCGVLESVLASYRPLAQAPKGSVATHLIAWLGPCIGPQAFEVGPEVRAAFLQDPNGRVPADRLAACFEPVGSDKFLADLAGLARLRLAALGVTEVYGNDSSLPWCTVANPLRFFSHRRDRVSGRMAACVWRE